MVLTFQECVQLLGNKAQKKIGNNTTLRRVDGYRFAICLHSTDVVEICMDGNYILNSGGWRTVTTKSRINQYSPIGVCQKKGVWYINDQPFRDGMRIDPSGKLRV